MHFQENSKNIRNILIFLIHLLFSPNALNVLFIINKI
jgi:hypothetical protein